jgi:hypothetical protein
MKPLVKRVVKLLLWSVSGFLLLAGIVLWTQKDTLRRDWENWQREYQASGLEKALRTEVSQLPPVDEVEVYRLSFKPVFPGQSAFHRSVEDRISLYEVKKSTLKDAEAVALADLWRSLSVTRNGVGCHEPHHALRFLNHGKQVSLAIICFQCENAEIPCTFLGGELVEFDSRQPQYTALKKRIEELVGAAP